MSAPLTFLSSLLPGDLVAATTYSSGKLHLVHIVRPVTADMCRGEPSHAALVQMFDCRPLCEVRPRYWWRPTDQHEHWKGEDKCRWCYAKWRAAGRPKIKGWAKVEAPLVSDVRLPWGWHEVTPTGHPLDLPSDAPDPDPDDDKAGEKRVEVKRWIRGPRYVRITQSLTDKRFCVRYGMLDGAADAEGWWLKGGWDAVLCRALAMMALGGVKGRVSTKMEKMTLRELA